MFKKQISQEETIIQIIWNEPRIFIDPLSLDGVEGKKNKLNYVNEIARHKITPNITFSYDV